MKSMKKLNFVRNQNDKILVIFLCLQAKLQPFKITQRCCSAQAIENFFGSCLLFNSKKACFFSFALLRWCKSRKKAFTMSTCLHTEQ